MTKDSYRVVIFGDINSESVINARWEFGDTWFMSKLGGSFLFTIGSPKESTSAEIKVKYYERIKEWENEK